ncbi:MAG: Gfo/Idh/MocA family protein [Limisphaerales bacterium]
MNTKIRVAVVGCGYWGPNLVRNLSQTAGCEVVLVCDASENRLRHMKGLYPAVPGTTRFEDVIENPNVDAVIVATPVRFHYPMGKAALEAGKHVFIEKPLARTVAECEELMALSEAKGLVLMVGHTFLFSPAVNRMKEIIESGDIGKVRYISASRLNLGLFQKDINVAWDLAPHDLSIILHLLEASPISVGCQGSCHVARGIEDVTTMYLNFKHDCCAMVQSSWLDPKKVRQMTVVGSRRMIVYDDMEPLEKIKVYDARVEAPPNYDTFAQLNYQYHHGDVYIPYIRQDEPLKMEMRHFIECIREGIQPICGGPEGTEVVRILEGANQSLRQNGVSVSLVPSRALNGNGNKTAEAQLVAT